jgi:hypothetical protein
MRKNTALAEQAETAIALWRAQTLHELAARDALDREFPILSVSRTLGMIVETQPPSRLARWAFLTLLVLGIPLACIPARGQAASQAVSATSNGAEGKEGQLRLNFHTISIGITEYQQKTGRYPRNLTELNMPLPKDVYSPAGENYRYEAQRSRFILSSCGKDGVYGNDDDEILIGYRGGSTSGLRHELYPLEKEEEAKSQKESVVGERPRGSCSIGGKVISEETGEPIARARMYLHYNVTHGSIFIDTDSNGDFLFNDIPTGPFSLQLSHSSGYQDVSYNPDNQPGQFPPFSLQAGEHRSGIVLKARQACRISGKILQENGKTPKDIDAWTVLASSKKDNKGYESRHALVTRKDGSYSIDGLDNKPVYVMAINWKAAREGNADPPVYYPGTFSRNDAKPITFDKARTADGADITLRKEGGFIIEGAVRDETGKPIPEAFVVVHRRDMLFDFVTAYTDDQGHYQIHGLGEGEFLLHVDAVHRGFVRMRIPVNLGKASEKTRRDITLTHGVLISGKLVGGNGNDWQIGESYGQAHMTKDQTANEDLESHTFSLTGFRNKYRPQDSAMASGGSFALGEGGYTSGEMIFPTKSTFVIQGMMPGHTMIGFSPNKEGQKVVKILHDGDNIMDLGLDTKPGEEIKDITIVIGTE